MPDAYNNRRHCMGHHRSVQLQHRGRYIWFRHSILEDHIYTGGCCRSIYHIILPVSRQGLIPAAVNKEKMPTDTISAGIFPVERYLQNISLIIINAMHTAIAITSGIDIIPGFLISVPSSAYVLCLLNISSTSFFLPLSTARA